MGVPVSKSRVLGSAPFQRAGTQEAGGAKANRGTAASTNSQHAMRKLILILYRIDGALTLSTPVTGVAHGVPIRHNDKHGTDRAERDRSPGLRTALISALAACADKRFQQKVCKFLQGLSRDELEYIAEFLGACLLESSGDPAPRVPGQAASGIAHFDWHRWQSAEPRPARGLSDREHKMIVLHEYVCRANLKPFALPVEAEPI
jgi:hypothetical protein